jgi:hypothetical protein
MWSNWMKRSATMVIREREDARTELDGAGAIGGDSHEGHWVRDDLPAGGVVLPDPSLVVSEVVQHLDQFEVAVDGERGIVIGAMEGREEDAELHAAWSVGH